MLFRSVAVKHADALQLVESDFAAGVVGEALVALFIALAPDLIFVPSATPLELS